MSGVALSVVLTTIGRPTDLAPLLGSLAATREPGTLQLVITDQSDDGANATFVTQQDLPFQVLTTTSPRGASAGRNAGLALASGAVVCFPDDTSWYAAGTLDAAVALLTRRTVLAGVCGILRTPDGRPSMLRWADTARPVTRTNWYRTSIEATLFLRRTTVSDVGGFDETMGAGSTQGYGSGEASDLVLRLLAAGHRLEYDPALVVHHHEPRDELPEGYDRKMAAYGAGFGRLFADHRLPIGLFGWLLARKAAGAGLHRVRGQVALARSDWAFLRGSLAGYRRRR